MKASTLHPKAFGAGLGVGSGGSLSVLIIWLLGKANVTVDVTVATILAAYLTGLFGFLGSWLAPILDAERAKLLDAPKTTTSSSSTPLGSPSVTPVLVPPPHG